MPGRPSLLHSALPILAIAACAVHAQTPTVTAFSFAPYAVNPQYMRLGTPITYSGRVLPADATGTLTLTVDTVPVQTIHLSPQTLADYVALGDSITYSSYIADPAQRYPNILASALNLNLSNYAVPGYGACDVMPTEALPFTVGETIATNPVYSLLIGTNDLALFGTGAHEQVFNLCHQATLAWLGIPLANKILIGNNAATITSGTWSGDTSNTLSTSTPGSTLRFNLTTTGAPAYLWYGIQTNGVGTFTISVDGAAPTVGPPAYASTVGVSASSYALLRIPIAAGNHTFDIANQSGTLTMLGMGSPPVVAGTTVLAGDVPNQVNGNTSGIAAYTADIQTNIALLQSDGLDIRFVPTQQFMLATPAEMVDTKHPNAVGLAELAAAFSSAISPMRPAVDSSTTSAASFTAISLPLGAHGVDIVYSGDSKYSAGDAGNITVVIFDGTSSASLTADAAVYPTQSPITLTATIPQPKASGLVTFVDQSRPIGSAWLNQLNAGQAQLILPSLPPGIHSITAQYLGDIVYSASTSAPTNITVSGSYTTTSLTTPATRYFATTPVPLTAVVSPTSVPGTIEFLDGAITLGQFPVVGGTANLTTAALAPGIHVLTAAYSGSASQDPSTSPALSIEIDPNATTLTLSSSPASVPFGSPITIVATVAPTAATGAITLLEGSQFLGHGTLSNGTATLSTNYLSPGAHTLTAFYSGDTNYLSSSAAITTQVTYALSTITLAPIPATATVHAPITLTASITPVAATGSITFLDGNATLAQVAVSGGTGSTIINTLAPGPHSITAAYSGDNFRSASTSAAMSTTITATTSAITLAQPPTSIHAGNAMTLAASISPTSASGTVIFRDATLGVLGQSTVITGNATLTLASPVVGAYSITAIYNGDTDDTAATSNSVTAQVILNPTTSTIIASTTSALVATPVTFTANVVPASGTGSFTFLDGNTPIGSALITNGQASLTTAILAAGSHALQAAYSGDSLYAASIAAPIAETINLATSATTLNFAQNPIIASGQVIANIAVSSSANNPTGTVVLRSGSSILASGSLGNASNGSAYVTLPFSAATLGIGVFPLVATYSGDVSNPPSSASANFTIAAIPTASTLTLSATQIPIQGSITLTAAVTAPATGSVTFLSNGKAVGTAAVGSSGTAAYTFTPPSMGSYVLSANFSPTGLFGASTSTAQTVTVTAPLSATLNFSAVSTGPGTTASATLTLTPLSGFTGPIQTTCRASVAFITCTVTPPTSLSAPVSAPVQINVASTSIAQAVPIPPTNFAIALALLLPLTLLRNRRSKLLIPLLVATFWIAGCAEGGNFADIPPGPQTITITTTAANTPISASLTVNIVD